MSSKNPYGQAADAYGLTAAETDQRVMEGRALLKAASKIEDLSKRVAAGEEPSLEDIGSTVEHNRKLWTLFASEVTDPASPLPQKIKNDIATLAIYVFKRSNEVLIEPTPAKMKILMDINRNIASGLMKQVAAPGAVSTSNPLTAKPGDARHPVELQTDSLV